MKNIPWSYYQLFLAVIRHGGLSGAAAEHGVSPATAGRHMLDLERRLGRALFVRSQRGYSLTPEGETLNALLTGADGSFRRIDDWRGEAAAPQLVRLALGTWNAFLISAHIGEICREDDPFRLQLLVGEARASLAHRENDIGIRSFEPEESNLAALRLGTVAYAPFRARNAPPSAGQRWIAVTREAAISDYLKWPYEARASAIVLSASRPRTMLDLVEAGAGIAVLPCFIGDTNQSLARAGPIIGDLSHGQWLVLHDEERHRRAVRRVADRLAKFMRARLALYAGKRADSEY
ncbi:MAG: LysR family transcriptional regulator [Rhizobiaceae bacterium]|nr:LysR family transcriptional regulator [Rhizobiaceae bacterium]